MVLHYTQDFATGLTRPHTGSSSSPCFGAFLIDRTFLASLLLALLSCSTSLAQLRGNISATSKCGVASIHQTVTIGDEGQHSISLDQRLCKWDKPIDLVGLLGTEYTTTGVDDVQFNKSRDQGYVVGTVSNGDSYFLRYEGSSTLKDGVPLHLEGDWSYSGGTGKLLGLKGGGRYSAKPTSDGSMVFEIQGTYEIPPAH